jgi:mxaD protein
MKNLLTAAMAALAWLSGQAFGAEANTLTAGQSILINAPADAVWAVVGDYNGSPRWLPLVERSEIVVGRNNEVGAIRLITRRNGTKVTERLLEHDSGAMRMAYTYVDGAVMAADYFPVITVTAMGDGTSMVRWGATFRRLAYHVDPPPPGQDDKSLTDFYNAIYKAGLESLKRVVEGGE